MALTELQIPTKENFYGTLRNAATQMDNLITKWRNLAEFVGFVETVDLDTIGVPTGQIRTDLNQFKAVLSEMVNLYDGIAVTPANTPADIIDKIRSM